MRFPLSLRAARACVLATLVFSLGLAPSFARMGGAARSLGRLRNGPFSNISRRTGSTGALRLADLASTVSVRRFDRFSSTGLAASASIASIALAGTSFSSAAAGVGAVGAASPLPAASEPIIVGDGAPVIINIGVDPGPGDAGRRLERRLRHPQAQLRQHRQICGRAPDPAVLIELGRACSSLR